MSTVVLDASVLLALLHGEPGARTMEGALGDARMSVVGMAEVASHFHRLGMPPDPVDQMLGPLPVALVPADAELCWEAGRTDRVCLGCHHGFEPGLGDHGGVILRHDACPSVHRVGTSEEVGFDGAEHRDGDVDVRVLELGVERLAKPAQDYLDAVVRL